MNIRTATDDDVPTIALQGMQFIGRLKLKTAANVDTVTTAVAAIVNNPNGVVLVGETDEGEVVGFLIGILVPLWFNEFDWSAVELAWWVDPEHRGRTGIRFIKAFEQWAASHHVYRVVLSDVEFSDGATPAGPLVERMGYQLHERAFSKEM